jgi:hypothetical protein
VYFVYTHSFIHIYLQRFVPLWIDVQHGNFGYFVLIVELISVDVEVIEAFQMFEKDCIMLMGCIVECRIPYIIFCTVLVRV